MKFPTAEPDISVSPHRMCPNFSIIIPVYNGGKAFEQSLSAVAAAVRPGDEIIVVADGESDGAYKIAPQYGARLIKLDKNGGPGRARNFGARAASGDILFFVDADVTVKPDALNVIESIFESDPTLSALIGSYDENPSQPNFVSQFKNLLHHYVHQKGSSEASTFWGACGAIKREVFLEFGGFAEYYTRASIEDIELGYRLTTKKHRIRLAKDLQIKHLKRWEPYSLVKTEIFLRAKPWTRLLWKQMWWDGKVMADLNLDNSHRFSLITSALIVMTLAAGFYTPLFFIAPPALFGIFLLLNRPVLRFFYEKRGFKFAAAAAGWRFVYDLYSWVGFWYGTGDSAFVAVQRLAHFTFSKIDALALGVAVGAVFALGLFSATGILILRPGTHEAKGLLELLSQFMPGYEVSWRGASIGSLQAFVYGYAFGALFATIRNFSMRLVMGVEKVNRALTRLVRSRVG
jgi:glycosyltransferase involved in cell wall biosynthesis